MACHLVGLDLLAVYHHLEDYVHLVAFHLLVDYLDTCVECHSI